MKLTQEEIRYMNALDRIAKVIATDCIIKENEIIFVVKENQLGMAIGKNGEKIKEIAKKLGKRVMLFEQAGNEKEFLEKAFRKFKIMDVSASDENGKKHIQMEVDSESKRKILSDTAMLRNLKEVLKKEYNVENLRLV